MRNECAAMNIIQISYLYLFTSMIILTCSVIVSVVFLECSVCTIFDYAHTRCCRFMSSVFVLGIIWVHRTHLSIYDWLINEALYSKVETGPRKAIHTHVPA